MNAIMDPDLVVRVFLYDSIEILASLFLPLNRVKILEKVTKNTRELLKLPDPISVL